MRASRVIALFGLVCGLSACDALRPPKPKEYTWTEDVALDAGSIRVRRVVGMQETNSWSGDAYEAIEKLSRIEFMDELASLPPWREVLRPIVLYRDAATGEWVVVASTTSCDVWRAAGKPKPPYWEFRLQADRWNRVPLSDVSLARRANLAQAYKSVAAAGHLTQELRAKLDPSAKLFRTFRSVKSDPNQEFCGEGYSSEY